MSKYVEIYEGVKVPDTASHVKTVGLMLFYRNIGGRLEYYSNANDGWRRSEIGLKDVVELPLAEPAAWMPEVGQECEVESDARNDWRKAMYVGVDSIGSHVFDVEKRNLWRIDSINILVRPLKTEAEKKRDAFIEAAMGLTSDGEQYSVERLAGMMFDNGFKAPEGDQS